MRKAGLVFVVLLLVFVAQAMAQEIPKLPPLSDPQGRKAYTDSHYPSARVCGECHPKQFAEWSLSSHAYAAVSPMFNKFEQRINDLARGTINSFCVRCHASVGTALGDPRDISWWDRSGSAQEGITCVTCHRVGEAYSKSNGARRITPGDISEPVFGPFDTTGVLKAISNAQLYKILVSSDQPDRPGYVRIHQQAIQSTVIQQSELCVTCHQVQVHAGIKLETVWEEYRASPAFKEGTTCQDCHMSPVPGQKVAFPRGPAALLPNGGTVNDDRPLSDHLFVGPGYPISHPGLFPIPLVPSRFTPQQWLKFDYRAKWGSDEFEKNVPASVSFPPEWQNAADRKEAWGVVVTNLARWEDRKKARIELLELGSKLDGPFFTSALKANRDLSFDYKLTNLNKGHNLPSGSLGAQPELWLNVVLTDPDGKRVWESGYVDSRGDFADLQSRDVRERKISDQDPFKGKPLPFDAQLFSMGAKFITTNVKGTDREMFLPINLDFDQLPFIRPGGTPSSVNNHPPNVRMEKHSIPPLATRAAHYKVPASQLTKPGKYRLAVRIRGRTEPMYFMDFVFATTDMERNENEWVTDTHQYAVEFEMH
jgi:nitrate/TMAO reductase-like tetraheme cytochrome c subunit